MPTPVGHVMGGVSVYLAAWGRPSQDDLRFVAACVGVSLLPDLDFAIGPLTGRNYHHYFTHSLGFAALLALAAYLTSRIFRRTKPLQDAAVLTAVYLSHILLDMLGKDTSPPFGVQFFWPFSETFYISPHAIFDEVWRGTLGKLFGPHNWRTMAREVLILLPIGTLLWWWHRPRELVL